jgi:two-component system, chemotaxis family, protein-glutamate methylesterase/glutaminase
MATYRIVVVAASAGGLTALTAVLGRLPATFGLPVAVVQHIDPHHVSRLADILGRRARLRVKEADDGDLLEAGAVYIAPPAHHLVVAGGGTLKLTDTAPVHFSRPSADRLFESAARAFGPAIGVILTGTGTDGATGAAAIKAGGGVMIVQDEATSAFFGMPHAAIDAGAVDYILPLGEIAPTLVRLAGNDEP